MNKRKTRARHRGLSGVASRDGHAQFDWQSALTLLASFDSLVYVCLRTLRKHFKFSPTFRLVCLFFSLYVRRYTTRPIVVFNNNNTLQFNWRNVKVN